MIKLAPTASVLLLSLPSCDAGSPPSGARPAMAGNAAQDTGGQSAVRQARLEELVGVAPQTSTPTVETEADGAPRRIIFDTGSPVVIRPLRITGRKPGVVAECAVRIDGRVIVTIGKAGSETEVLLCGHLEDAGALPPDGVRRRLGLIYSAGSPNTNFQVPIMLFEVAGGQWALDETAFERFAEQEAETLKDMAKVLVAER